MTQYYKQYCKVGSCKLQGKAKEAVGEVDCKSVVNPFSDNYMLPVCDFHMRVILLSTPERKHFRY